MRQLLVYAGILFTIASLYCAFLYVQDRPSIIKEECSACEIRYVDAQNMGRSLSVGKKDFDSMKAVLEKVLAGSRKEQLDNFRIASRVIAESQKNQVFLKDKAGTAVLVANFDFQNKAICVIYKDAFYYGESEAGIKLAFTEFGRLVGDKNK